MTSSFTTTEQFGTQMGDDFGDEQQYPEAFGITFTPQVTGIAVGVAGLLIAAYLLWSQVLPVWGELSELKAEQQEKQNQLNQLNQNQLQLKIQEKERELADVNQIKEEVINLYATDTNLQTLLLEVNNFANLNNLKLYTFLPVQDEREFVQEQYFDANTEENIQMKTYRVVVEGTYSQIKLFAQDLERLQPLLVVRQIITEARPLKYVVQGNQLVAEEETQILADIYISAIIADLQPIESEETTE